MAKEDGRTTQTKRRRTADLSVRFENGRVKGWALRVGECFRPALDILQTERVVRVRTAGGELARKRLVFTEGRPPLYAFAAGDAIGTTHFPEDDGDHILLQVRRASPDQWDDAEGRVRDGRLRVVVYRPGNPNGWEHTGSLDVTQQQFVAMLRTGQVPPED